MKSPQRIDSLMVLIFAILALGLPAVPVARATPPVCQVWVTSRTTNYPTIIDGATSDVSTLDIGDDSWHVAMTPDGSKVYITTGSGTDIKVIDVSGGYALSTIVTPSFVVGVSPDGTKMYTTDWGADTVREFNTATDLATGRSVARGTNPSAMVSSPDGTHLYVANYNSNPSTVTKIATSGFTATDEPVDAGYVYPSGVEVSPDGSTLYVVMYGGNVVKEFDTATMTAGRSVAVAAGSRGVVSNSTGSRLYVTSVAGNHVVEIDITTFAITDTIAVGNSPQNLVISPDDRFLFVTNQGSDTVSKIDLSTNTVVETIAVNNEPYGIAIGPSSCTTTAAAPAPAPAPVAAPETTVESTTTTSPATTVAPTTTTSQPTRRLPETGSDADRWLWLATLVSVTGVLLASRRRRPT